METYRKVVLNAGDSDCEHSFVVNQEEIRWPPEINIAGMPAIMKTLVTKPVLCCTKCQRKEIDEELNELYAEFSKALFEMDPGMAKKVIVSANLEIAKLDNIRLEADKSFKNAKKHMDAGRYIMANADFVRAEEQKTEIGDEKGIALALEMQVRCLLAAHMFMRSVICQKVAEALKIFKENGDYEGVKRIEQLTEEIKRLIKEMKKKK